jgi:DegV family protein with EDD domain
MAAKKPDVPQPIRKYGFMKQIIVRRHPYRLVYGLVLALLAALLISGLAACQRNRLRPASPTPAALATGALPNRQVSVVIEPNKGGEVALNNGATVSVPPDALTASTVVNLHVADQPPAAPIPRSIIGQAYEFSLEGGTLTGIAMLTLPLPANVTPEQYDLAAYRWTGRTWERIASRTTQRGLRFGADKPGTFALLGQWHMADAALAIAIPPLDPGRPTVPVQVTGHYRYTAPPQMQHDMTAATLLLKLDSTGGAGQVSGDESIDKTLAQTTLYFKPDPNQADGVIDFNYTFAVAPGDVDVPLGTVARLYAALSVADSLAPTRSLSTGADYTQMLPIQVIGSDVVRPDVSAEASQGLQWHVWLNGETLLARPAADTHLSLADVLAQGGLGEYKIALEAERDGKLTPVSNQVTVQLALPTTPTATPGPGELAMVTPGAGTPTVSPFGPMPPTPTRRPGPSNGTPALGGAGETGGGTGGTGAEATTTPTPTETPTLTPTSTRTPLANSMWADKYTVAAGECVRISWSFQNITSITFQGIGTTGENSSTQCPQETTTYTLNVTDASGTTPHALTITVPGTGTSSTISFSASAYQITAGESLTLNWDVQGVQQVRLHDSGNGETYDVDGVGSRQVSPGIDTTYTLEVLEAGGNTVLRQINILVTEPDAVNIRYWADQYTLDQDGCTNLHWEVDNVAEVLLQHGSETPEGVGGIDSREVCPGGEKTYTLMVRQYAGDTETIDKSITVLSGAPGTAMLSSSEVIARGIVRSISFKEDLLPSQAGSQPGYELLIDTIDPLYRGTGSQCCQIPVTIDLTQEQTISSDGEFLDWPINPDQQIEFRATCSTLIPVPSARFHVTNISSWCKNDSFMHRLRQGGLMTRIVADTTCGLAPEMAQELGIPLIPQIINFGEESFREGVDIDHAGFMARLQTSRVLPKTAAPYPGDFIEVFERFLAAGENIVCIHPSVDVSGTVRSALTAKDACLNGDIRIIDTRTIAGPLATLVLEADKLAKTGASADQVEALVREMMPRARIYFLVDTLEYLRRGGRIGGAATLVGSVLQIKPILTFTDGRIDQFSKERTKKRALARIKELVLAEAAHGEEAQVTVMYAGVRHEAELLAGELQAALGVSQVLLMDLVPAIITHAGPGALAVGFFTPRG